MYVRVLPTSITCMAGTQGGQKRTSGTLDLELWLVVSSHEDAGN